MAGGHGQDPAGEGFISRRPLAQSNEPAFFEGAPPPPDDDPPRQMSKEEWERATMGDIDPAQYAGEAFGATEEYFPQDIDDPYMRGQVTDPEGYYPGPDMKRRKWPPYRGPGE